MNEKGGESMRFDWTDLAGRRVCVALSGGGDSVALFFYLKEHAAEHGVTLSALNAEHGIRGGASLRDTAFVQELCAREGVPLFCFAADIPALAKASGRGIEEEARLFRRACYEEVLRGDRADVVATAHHAGDNAESVLFNLFRGASLTGVGGIRAFVPVMGEKGIARPLLGTPKEEIAAYLRERALAHCEDETNADETYARNFLRARVLAPAMERFPHAEEHVYSFSRDAREDDDFLNALAEKELTVCEDGAAWSLSLPAPLFRRCLVLAMGKFGVVRDVTRAHVAAVQALAEKQSGARVSLPAGLAAVREYGSVRLFRAEGAAQTAEIPLAAGRFAFAGGTLTVEERAYTAETLALAERAGGEGKRKTLVADADAFPAGCVLRTPRTGDTFRKFGGGTKLLKKYLTDKKIPARMRAELPVAACGERVFAVCGAEIAEDVKVTASTRRVYILTYEEK